MNPWLDDGDVQLYHGSALDVLRSLPAASVQTCVTSPPYWGLRDYGTGDAQLGLEATPAEYVTTLVAVFAEVWRVLRDDATCWINLGDSYASGEIGRHDNGHTNDPSHIPSSEKWERRGGRQQQRLRTGLKQKNLVGIPWRVAFALQEAGWYLRSDVIWSKPNPMPESVVDRPTKAHEYVFLLAKQPKYYYDADAIREPHRTADDARNRADFQPKRGMYDAGRPDGMTGPSGASTWPEAGRNARSVWEIATQPTPEAHFATFPEALVRRCILAGSREGDLCLDPFVGSGTTCLVARKHGRRAVGIDLSDAYLAIAARRLGQQSLFATSGGVA